MTAACETEESISPSKRRKGVARRSLNAPPPRTSTSKSRRNSLRRCSSPSAGTTKGEEEHKPAVARPISEIGSIMPAGFFLCDAVDLAPRLLGKLLRRDEVVLRITEVEAYRPGDSACHGRFGVTARTAPMFGPGGHAYVYLCYGMHMMLNVVADIESVSAAVLIRSCAPVSGLSIIQKRRGQNTDKHLLLSGPGKVGQALGLTSDWSGHPLYTPGGRSLKASLLVHALALITRRLSMSALRGDLQLLVRPGSVRPRTLSAP